MEVHVPPGPKAASKRKSQIQDESIMGTNNSSIVSKRSVERVYFPDEAHYFRFFVKKPQRRAPLINRGYWLRMKAIDHVVRQFLEAPSEKQKVVVNLGCGYDPLPWQCLSRYPAASKGTKFIDIDYRDLMLKKRDVVQKTNELNSMLTEVKEFQTGDVLLGSDQYIQIGCDLRELIRLNEALSRVIDIEASTIIFVAEVSITYMDVQASDALILWASGLSEAQFCLLEQILPDGLEHPFAATMMAHFGPKLRTPLGAIQKYPSTDAQDHRFRDLGWSNAKVINLWELWSSSAFLAPEERVRLDAIEPFDEWEDFALFGCHYFLLVADNFKHPSEASASSSKINTTSQGEIHPLRAKLSYTENPKGQGLRRFGAPLKLRRSGFAGDGIGNFAGVGLISRTSSCDMYLPQLFVDISSINQKFTSGPAPSSRMCHSITDLGDAGQLLVGGRTSPDNALSDCWLYHKWTGTWERIDDLPQPRYRHSTVHLGHGCVLVSPGRNTSRDIAGDFFVWSRCHGWRICRVGNGEVPRPTYGSTFSIFENSRTGTVRTGIIAGGVGNEGLLMNDVWEWSLSSFTNEGPEIQFSRSYLTNMRVLARFGAAVVNQSGRTYVLGGIVRDSILKSTEQVYTFVADSSSPLSTVPNAVPIESSGPRQLFIGLSVTTNNNSLVIMGGSAVCFSFGTFWNKGCSTFHMMDVRPSTAQLQIEDSKPDWHYVGTLEAQILAGNSSNSSVPMNPSSSGLVTIPRVHVRSASDFRQILQASKPVIITDLDLGPCTVKWTPSYLKEQIGARREVVVHEATAEHMNFRSKNFSYVTKAFGKFLEEADDGAKLYLRSLSSESPTQLPANLERDFPSIAKDFVLPRELAGIIEDYHSSPLRISGPVVMWLHYDVMANVLCQIRGSKRLLLFPPSDVEHFAFEAGASSSHQNVFNKSHGELLSRTHPHQTDLEPGEVLFIPPFWLHTASPTTGLSIAVNVFFRSLQTGYAAGKDVYGNRDLKAYEKGRQDIARVVKSFDDLPADIREFYLTRLAQEFAQKAR